MNPTPSPLPYLPQPVPAPDELWWLAPAICTPLALLLAYADFAGSGFPLVWALGYALPLAFVAGAWGGAKVRYKRVQRIVFGITGCAFAFVYTKTLMAVLMPMAIVLWLVHGDG
ncbi:hypothetical protein QZH56_12400 [Streptomyces olivoreticuli]|uniref:hypothetical protein n=1 Tax=Streptomyces olivoreticuli TaxID=68246 RepID=UPI002657EA49|nr:hypothetical protein [Streptomyces olivoreticuli]WKK26321.1 hypothetical protein QZH56_12400 [Streptomyces olivoreticuli]